MNAETTPQLVYDEAALIAFGNYVLNREVLHEQHRKKVVAADIENFKDQMQIDKFVAHEISELYNLFTGKYTLDELKQKLESLNTNPSAGVKYSDVIYADPGVSEATAKEHIDYLKSVSDAQNKADEYDNFSV